MKQFKLWEENSQVETTIDYYEPLQKASDIAVVIFPGGGYFYLAKHEGEGYAHLLNSFGITAFVVNYRVFPNYFPKPLLDARRAIRFVRSNAQKFAINKEKIYAMGSSAGGHLVALLSTYLKDIGEIKDDLYKESFLPNGQILCYPVISADERIFHSSSFINLLGERYIEKDEYSPELLVNKTTPPAFIWHAADDSSVPVMNSYRYAQALSVQGISHELHVFSEGGHGAGIAPQWKIVNQWVNLLQNWLMTSL